MEKEMNKAIEILQHLFTARDGESYSLTKLLVIASAVAMIYKFVTGDSADYSGFGTGIALLGAVQVGKYAVEDK